MAQTSNGSVNIVRLESEHRNTKSPETVDWLLEEIYFFKEKKRLSE